MVDGLEEQGIEVLGKRHLSRKGTDLDLVEQFNIYEVRKPRSVGREAVQSPQTHRAGCSFCPLFR